MARTELESIETMKQGKGTGKIYYARDIGDGRLRVVSDKAEANVADFEKFTREDGRTPRFLQRGGIAVITWKTDEELRQLKAEKAKKRREKLEALKQRVYNKLLKHPPKAFLGEFAKRYTLKLQSEAKKKTKAEIQAKINALKEQKKNLG